MTRSLAELNTALEELRLAQEQLVESRARIEQLQDELRLSAERYWQLFDEVPQPYVVTKSNSAIVEVNRAGAELFNVSQRFLIGKTLSVFVCEDRTSFLETCARVAADRTPARLTVKIRPRERAPLRVAAKVIGDATTLRWMIQPSD